MKFTCGVLYQCHITKCPSDAAICSQCLLDLCGSFRAYFEVNVFELEINFS